MKRSFKNQVQKIVLIEELDLEFEYEKNSILTFSCSPVANSTPNLTSQIC